MGIIIRPGTIPPELGSNNRHAGTLRTVKPGQAGREEPWTAAIDVHPPGRRHGLTSGRLNDQD